MQRVENGETRAVFFVVIFSYFTDTLTDIGHWGDFSKGGCVDLERLYVRMLLFSD